MNKYLINSVLCLIVTMILFVPVVSAQNTAKTPENTPDNSNTQYTLLEPLPNLDTGKGTIATINFKDYVEYFFNLIIALSAAAAVFMIVFGGFQYMTTDSWTGKKEGLQKVKFAVLGLLLVLSSYLLLRTIDPRLVNIPSTLVKPLDIKYERVSLTFMKQIDNQIAELSKGNWARIAEIKAKRAELSELEDKGKQLENEIKQLLYEDSRFEQSVSDVCNAGVPMSKEIMDKCMEWQRNQQGQRDLSINIKQETAVGQITAVIQECYVASHGSEYITLDECKKKINEYSMWASVELIDLNAGETSKYISDYADYAQATVAMYNSVIVNTKDSEASKAFVDTIKQSSTAVGVALGATYGGVAGAGGGFVAAQLFNGVVLGAEVIKDREDAARAAMGIIDTYNIYTQVISDPKIKAVLIAQTNVMLKGLGSTRIVDGTPVKIPSADIPQQNFNSSDYYGSGELNN